MIIFNDASLHGQFPAPEPFRESLRNLWEIRSLLVEKGLQLKVCHSIRTRNVTPTQTFNDFLGLMPRENKTRLLLWLDKEGPFWDDERRHPDSEYFECDGGLVTDTGAAEAAFLRAEGLSPWLFSISPSCFLSNPLAVYWRGRTDGDLVLDIPNGFTNEHAEQCASSFVRSVESWDELLAWAERECPHLALSPKIREQLPKQFIHNVAKRSQVLLGVLNQIVGFMKAGNSEEYNRMCREWMQGGESARFSPSSESELRDFSSDLTFRRPDTGVDLLCSWHGKIKSPQYRIHFEWPLPSGADRLFVAYIGPKITKR